MDCLSNSFKNSSCSRFVFSIRLALSVADVRGASPGVFSSFRRTRASTGVASSSSFFGASATFLWDFSSIFSWVAFFVVSRIGCLWSFSLFFSDSGVTLLPASFPALTLSGSLPLSFTGSLLLSDGWIPSVWPELRVEGRDGSSGFLTSSSLTGWFSSVVFAVSTADAVMACSSEVTVSAATIGPTRASPINTDATPIAYFRIEKRCFRWNSIQNSFIFKLEVTNLTASSCCLIINLSLSD